MGADHPLLGEIIVGHIFSLLLFIYIYIYIYIYIKDLRYKIHTFYFEWMVYILRIVDPYNFKQLQEMLI
jgi:hypothetical protein